MKHCFQCKKTYSIERWQCPICGVEVTEEKGIVTHCPNFLSKETQGFKPEYFANLAEIEEINFWFVSRNELIISMIGSKKPITESMLEIGRGTGFVLAGIANAYPKMALTGSEIFMSGLRYAKNRLPSACFMQMDARFIPYKEEFNLIGAFDVLEHIDDDCLVLGQIYKALKPGGVFLLTVPQHAWLWSVADEYACHVRRYECKDLHKKLSDAGFDIERSTSFVSLLLPLMIYSRCMKKFKTTDDIDLVELRISKILNNILLFTMRIEKFLIGIGINFPFGGSRLILARKGFN